MTTPLDDLRAVVAQTAPPPEAMSAYLARVRTRAYTVTDAEVAGLLAAGCTEDEVFEQTVAAAISEGLRRLDAAERVLG